MLIGAGRLYDGLYAFIVASPTPIKSIAATTTTYELWHEQLGHLSRDRIKLLSSYVSGINFPISDHCGICPLAKQTRLPFCSSNTNSLAPFDLIHYDIWGPYRSHTFTYWVTLFFIYC